MRFLGCIWPFSAFSCQNIWNPKSSLQTATHVNKTTGQRKQAEGEKNVIRHHCYHQEIRHLRLYFKASIFIIAYLNGLIYCAAEQDCSRSSCLRGENAFIVQGSHMLSSFKTSLQIRREPCSSVQHLSLKAQSTVFRNTKYHFCSLIIQHFGLKSK